MENIIDASSKYQNSLPISSDAILNLLKTWKIPYTRTDHVPLRTVEESKKVQDQFLSTKNGGGHIKTLIKEYSTIDATVSSGTASTIE